MTFSFGNSKDSKDKTEVKESEEKIDTKKILKLTEDNIKKFKIAQCCKPIPGDDVLGYIDEDNHIIIHKRQCPIATKLKSSYGNRIIAAEWDSLKSLPFLVSLQIEGIDDKGLLNEITQVISQRLNVNIHKVSMESNDGIFEGKFQLYVHDVNDVKTISANLRKIKNVKSVSRVEE